MDNPLKRLLETEARAKDILDTARAAQQSQLDATLASVREAEARFDANRATLRAPYLQEAQARADRTIADLTEQYTTRQHELRDLAARNEHAAVAAAMQVLLDPTR